MTTALDRVRRLLDQAPPAVLPGQLAVRTEDAVAEPVDDHHAIEGDQAT